MKLLLQLLILLLVSSRVIAQQDTCVLPKPENLYITHESGCKTIVHWDPVVGAEKYSFKYTVTADSSWSEPDLTTDTERPVQNVSPIAEYTYAVAAVCSNGSLSGYEKLTAIDSTCEPPQNVKDTVKNNTEIKFTWSNCWSSNSNQLRYRFVTDTFWTYVYTGSAMGVIIPIPHNGFMLFQVSALPDSNNTCWSVIDTVHITVPPPKPSQIIILLDDMRFDTYSCNGGPAFFQSPSIDRIANEGVNFKNSFVVFSLCNPSRATILTGLYANHNGAVNNKSMFYSYLPTIGTIMDQAGYYTAFFGKYLNANEEDPVPQPGWDYWMARVGSGHIDATFNWNGFEHEFNGHVADVITDSAVAIINRVQQPFLIYLCYTTHPAWVPRKQDARLYTNADIKLPPNYSPYTENYPSFIYNSIFTAADSLTLTDDLRRYYQVLYGIDAEIERLFSALEGKNILDSTLILFTSDNGMLMGEHLLEGKRLPYEESIRVPMFIRYPKWFPPNSVVTDEMALNVDIAPTLFDLAGVPDTIATDGLSLHKVFDGTTSRSSFYYQGTHLNDSSVNTRSVRSFNYKYNYYYCDNATEEFFDLSHDPFENINLINNMSYQDLIQDYRWKEDSFKNALGDDLVEEIRSCDLENVVIIDTPVTADIFFPNPTSDYVNIEFLDVDSSQHADILIYDMNGLVVFELQNVLFIPGRIVKINLSSLVNGLYDVQFRFNRKTANSKLVIMK